MTLRPGHKFGTGGSIPAEASCNTVWSIPAEHPQQDPTEHSSEFPTKDVFFFSFQPVSHWLSLKRPPGQLLLQAPPWYLPPCPGHRCHFTLSTTPMKILCSIPTRSCPRRPVPVVPSLTYETRLVQNPSVERQTLLLKAKPGEKGLAEAGASGIPSASAAPPAQHTRATLSESRRGGSLVPRRHPIYLFC